MRKNSKIDFQSKKLIVFDLDGTLAPTKATMDPEMTELFAQLLRIKKVAVIGGGKYGLFKEQLVRSLFGFPRDLLTNLFLFPTTSTSFYRYQNGWKKVYTHELSLADRKRIKQTFREVLKEINYVPPQKTYGPVIEDRRTQVTFSALGQDVVKVLGGKKGVRMKLEWKEKNTPLKLKITRLMAKRLPHLEVRAAGYTSIDVTRKGIDKAYGLYQIEKYLKVPIKDMFFVGDAIFPGGNDYAAVRTGVQTVQVSGPKEAKKVIRKILKLSRAS